MDYGLFTSVDDGMSLQAAEAEAFYASLSASKSQKDIPDAPLLDDTSLVSLLDPASDWLRLHRGDQIVLNGTARRITKVLVEAGQDQAYSAVITTGRSSFLLRRLYSRLARASKTHTHLFSVVQNCPRGCPLVNK